MQQGERLQVRPADELPFVEQLFSRMLVNPAATDLESDAAGLGWSLTRIEAAGKTFTALADVSPDRTGCGAYLFAPASAPPVLLQAPHRFKDLRTGTLGLALLAEHPFLGAAFNTVPRNAAGSDGGSADLARRTESDLVALSQAFAQGYADGLIVQLHGYAPSARRTSAGRASEVILSNGTRHPDARTQAIFACLRREWGAGVRLYPWDVEELGGTLNPVGIRLRALGHAGFLHIELSLTRREALLASQTERERFARCLMTH